MAITLLPTPPTRDDPLNFADRADEFLAALPPFAVEANALATQINADAVAAAGSASNSATSAALAQSAANAATAAANYAGEWSTLTGSLASPATTSYQNQLYLLTTSVADVTAHTPGVSSVWLLVGIYRIPAAISTNTNALAFYSYKVTANCVVTLPAAPVNGQWIEFLNVTGTNNFTIARNGKTIMGVADNLNVNVNNKSFRLVYVAASNDWLLFV